MTHVTYVPVLDLADDIPCPHIQGSYYQLTSDWAKETATLKTGDNMKHTTNNTAVSKLFRLAILVWLTMTFFLSGIVVNQGEWGALKQVKTYTIAGCIDEPGSLPWTRIETDNPHTSHNIKGFCRDNSDQRKSTSKNQCTEGLQLTCITARAIPTAPI